MRRFVLIVLLALTGAPEAWAQTCEAELATCRAACAGRIPADREAALTGCRARCATDALGCDAEALARSADRAAREDVLPEMRRRLDQLRDLMDGFQNRDATPRPAEPGLRL